jgi:hypothetical protein
VRRKRKSKGIANADTAEGKTKIRMLWSIMVRTSAIDGDVAYKLLPLVFVKYVE